ncbi:NF038120 family PEP-CTERM protein [Chitinimonas sp.]|uniref:NF038120 family PEP-CTERM protein n=1 Tax=Chitinimonas sp. TaxID=1934313 RepID=UPI002F94200C
MNNSIKKALLAFAAALALPAAMASQITFDPAAPNIYAGGEGFDEAGYKLNVVPPLGGVDGGLNGAVVSNAASCVVLDCPVGNSTQYFLGLNDGGLKVSKSDGLGFRLFGFDASFVAPVVANIPFSVARIVIFGHDVFDNEYWTSFTLPGQNANGYWEFSNFVFDATDTWFRDVTFLACLTDESGQCVADGQNQAQFALDNVNLVPEPTSWALLGISLAAMLVAARRKRQF